MFSIWMNGMADVLYLGPGGTAKAMSLGGASSQEHTNRMIQASRLIQKPTCKAPFHPSAHPADLQQRASRPTPLRSTLVLRLRLQVSIWTCADCADLCRVRIPKPFRNVTSDRKWSSRIQVVSHRPAAWNCVWLSCARSKPNPSWQVSKEDELGKWRFMA